MLVQYRLWQGQDSTVSFSRRLDPFSIHFLAPQFIPLSKVRCWIHQRIRIKQYSQAVQGCKGYFQVHTWSYLPHIPDRYHWGQL